LRLHPANKSAHISDMLKTICSLQGWQGVQTIPRVVTYDADLNELVFYPVVELEQLRRELLYQGNVTLNQVGLQACLHPFEVCCMCLVLSQALLM